MPKKSAFDYMINFVQEYLDGTASRLDFELDFNYYLIENYPKMERENSELAECFNFYMGENGHDISEKLSDADHKKLIRKQFKEFKSVMIDGFYQR